MSKFLIPNWRNMWKALSVHVATLAVIWGALPGDAQAAMLRVIRLDESWVPLVFGIAFIIARLTPQPRLHE